MQAIRQLKGEYGDHVCWLGIYVAEAHAVDEWPMPFLTSPCRHEQPKSDEHRRLHAKEFTDTFQPPFDMLVDPVVDGWNDPFLDSYSAWPERFYIFQPNLAVPPIWEIRWWDTPSTTQGHRIDDIRGWLEANVETEPHQRVLYDQLEEEAWLQKAGEAFSCEAEMQDGVQVLLPLRVPELFESLGYLPHVVATAMEKVAKNEQTKIGEFSAIVSSHFENIAAAMRLALREVLQVTPGIPVTRQVTRPEGRERS